MFFRHALWRDRDFVHLWLAQAVSAVGARISREGLAIAAVLGLAAAPWQTGLLAALSSGPALVVGLFCGGWVDRSSRRRIMMTSDLLRAGILATVPIAAALHLLAMPHLYVAAALIGAASVLFQIADHAFLPSLIARDHLTHANASLSATEATAEIGGPALAGILFQLMTAPFALAVNAATYAVSALFLSRIRMVEEAIDAEPPEHVLADVATGFGAVWRAPMIRPLFFSSLTQGVFGGVFSALYIFFAVRVVGLQPGPLGLTIACGGAAALAGALLAERLSRRLGIGPAIVACSLVAGAATVFIVLAPADPKLGMASLIVAQLFGDSFGTALMVLTAGLFQTSLPNAVLGRAGASLRAIGGAGAVLGAVGGGVLGDFVGARVGLAIASAGILLTPLAFALSPLPRLRELAAPDATPQGDAAAKPTEGIAAR